ncbi:receptor-type tyrosine-protein phosphatase eta-like [Phyllobates terribilis]|uniref:receptor-type tyrosine-protein phosphatase eta-like n=1 Tax=Phyllobates terribilis TaxID=111132 RepID=UPI003CCAB47F
MFIALDCIINQLECDKKVDVCGTVRKIHLHRPLMVQTVAQYIFLHCRTLEIIRGKKIVNTDAQNVTEDRREDAITHTVYYSSQTRIESTQEQPSLP